MRPDGEVVHAMVSVSLTADSHDRPQGYIWQVVDVTEQRRAEQERAARAEAEAVVQTIGKLQQVTEAALAHLELDELLEVLVQRVCEVFARGRGAHPAAGPTRSCPAGSAWGPRLGSRRSGARSSRSRTRWRRWWSGRGP